MEYETAQRIKEKLNFIKELENNKEEKEVFIPQIRLENPEEYKFTFEKFEL